MHNKIVIIFFLNFNIIIMAQIIIDNKIIGDTKFTDIEIKEAKFYDFKPFGVDIFRENETNKILNLLLYFDSSDVEQIINKLNYEVKSAGYIYSSITSKKEGEFSTLEIYKIMYSEKLLNDRQLLGYYWLVQDISYELVWHNKLNNFFTIAIKKKTQYFSR